MHPVTLFRTHTQNYNDQNNTGLFQWVINSFQGYIRKRTVSTKHHVIQKKKKKKNLFKNQILNCTKIKYFSDKQLDKLERQVFHEISYNNKSHVVLHKFYSVVLLSLALLLESISAIIKWFFARECTLNKCLGIGRVASPDLPRFFVPSSTDGPSNLTRHRNRSLRSLRAGAKVVPRNLRFSYIKNKQVKQS